MLPQIRSFLTVVEEGSLHRAAARLRISQPALSRPTSLRQRRQRIHSIEQKMWIHARLQSADLG
jgi:hypothetical protein